MFAFVKKLSSKNSLMSTFRSNITRSRTLPKACQSTENYESVNSKANGLPQKEISIPVPLGQLSVKTWGNQNGFPTLALHGWMDNCGTFDKLIPMLSNNLYIIALDFPGHGFSSKKALGNFYNYLDMIMAIRHVMKHFNWNLFHIIGHSLGAEIAQSFAAYYPENVKKVVALDIIKPPSIPSADIPNIYAQSIDLNLEIEEKLRNKPPVYNSKDLVKRLIDGMHQEITEESAEVLLKRGAMLSEDGNGHVYTRDLRMRTIEYNSALNHDSMHALMKRIKAEMLIIRAKNTHPSYVSPFLDYDMTYCDVFKQHCKHFDLEYVEGNHFVHLNNPERVAPLINKFLTDGK